MNNTQYWLSLLDGSESLKVNNNEGLAKLLGLTRSAISHQKRGLFCMGTRAAVAAAYALEIHPMLIVASTQYDSSKNESDRIFWLTTYMKWADKAPRNIQPPILELLPDDLIKVPDLPENPPAAWTPAMAGLPSK